MPGEIQQLWEYRAHNVVSLWTGVKVTVLEDLLNTWGKEGWDVVSTHILENANKINVIVKRPLNDRTRRKRTML